MEEEPIAVSNIETEGDSHNEPPIDGGEHQETVKHVDNAVAEDSGEAVHTETDHDPSIENTGLEGSPTPPEQENGLESGSAETKPNELSTDAEHPTESNLDTTESDQIADENLTKEPETAPETTTISEVSQNNILDENGSTTADVEYCSEDEEGKQSNVKEEGSLDHSEHIDNREVEEDGEVHKENSGNGAEEPEVADAEGIIEKETVPDQSEHRLDVQDEQPLQPASEPNEEESADKQETTEELDTNQQANVVQIETAKFSEAPNESVEPFHPTSSEDLSEHEPHEETHRSKEVVDEYKSEELQQHESNKAQDESEPITHAADAELNEYVSYSEADKENNKQEVSEFTPPADMATDGSRITDTDNAIQESVLPNKEANDIAAECEIDESITTNEEHDVTEDQKGMQSTDEHTILQSDNDRVESVDKQEAVVEFDQAQTTESAESPSVSDRKGDDVFRFESNEQPTPDNTEDQDLSVHPDQEQLKDSLVLDSEAEIQANIIVPSSGVDEPQEDDKMEQHNEEHFAVEVEEENQLEETHEELEDVCQNEVNITEHEGENGGLQSSVDTDAVGVTGIHLLAKEQESTFEEEDAIPYELNVEEAQISEQTDLPVHASISYAEDEVQREETNEQLETKPSDAYNEEPIDIPEPTQDNGPEPTEQKVAEDTVHEAREETGDQIEEHIISHELTIEEAVISEEPTSVEEAVLQVPGELTQEEAGVTPRELTKDEEEQLDTIKLSETIPEQPIEIKESLTLETKAPEPVHLAQVGAFYAEPKQAEERSPDEKPQYEVAPELAKPVHSQQKTDVLSAKTTIPKDHLENEPLTAVEETILFNEASPTMEQRPLSEIQQRSRTLEPSVMQHWTEDYAEPKKKAATLGRSGSRRRERLQPKPAINDDHLFPDSVTPSKVEHDLSVRSLNKGLPKGTYDVPYIDDDAFLPRKLRAKENRGSLTGSEYSSEGPDWFEPSKKYGELDPAHVADVDECIPTPKIEAKTKSSPSKKKNSKKGELIKEKPEKPKHRNRLLNLCSCFGRRRNS